MELWVLPIEQGADLETQGDAPTDHGVWRVV